MTDADLCSLGRSEDAAFFHWLTGFIDGEGCFVITRSGGSAVCRFQLCVRDDDEPLLRSILKTTGIGTIYSIAASGTGRPQAMWMLGRKDEMRALVRLLDRYPLRSKKARDYEIWREAVSTWHQPRGPVRRARMAALAIKLRAIRAYETAGEEVPIGLLPGDERLSLFDEAA